MMTMLEKIKGYGAKSVKSCVLLHKKQPDNLRHAYWSDYIGYLIPLKFVIGYGLDYNEYVRDMKHICTISKAGIARYAV